MIFEDPSHRRWRTALLMFALLVVAAVTALGITVASIIVPPSVPDPFSSRRQVQAKQIRSSLEHDARPVYTAAQKKRMERIRAQERKRRDKLVSESKGAALTLPQNAVVAFTVQDDPASVASLERHVANIDIVVPDWFTLPGAGCELTERIDDMTRRVLGRADVLVFPRLANLAGDDWRGAQTSQLLANEKVRECLVQKLVSRLSALGAAGINVDLEELATEDSENFLELLVDLRNALHARSMRLTVDVPFHDPAFDFEYIGDVADAVMVMAYDQHYPSSRPGAIASRTWLKESYDEVLPRVPPDRVVVVLGNYGYDWSVANATEPAEGLSFRAAMDCARAAEAQPVFEEGVDNGHFGYSDHSGETPRGVVPGRARHVEPGDRAAPAPHHAHRHVAARHRGRDAVVVPRRGITDRAQRRGAAGVPPVKSVGLFGEGESSRSAASRIRRAQADHRARRLDRQRHVHARAEGYVVERMGGKGRRSSR